MLLFNPNLKAEVTRAWSRSDFGESVRHFRETLDSSAECLVAIQHGVVSTLALLLGLLTACCMVYLLRYYFINYCYQQLSSLLLGTRLIERSEALTSVNNNLYLSRGFIISSGDVKRSIRLSKCCLYVHPQYNERT